MVFPDRGLMAPLPLESLTYASSGGVAIDFIFSLAVQAFEGHRFWIEPRDLASKDALTIVAVLFNFLDSGGPRPGRC